MLAIADHFIIKPIVQQTGAQSAHVAVMDPAHDVRSVRRNGDAPAERFVGFLQHHIAVSESHPHALAGQILDRFAGFGQLRRDREQFQLAVCFRDVLFQLVQIDIRMSGIHALFTDAVEIRAFGMNTQHLCSVYVFLRKLRDRFKAGEIRCRQYAGHALGGQSL